MLWLGWLKYFDIFLCLPLGLVSVSGESVILGKSVEESSITQPQHSLNYTTSVLNTVSHTVNIKWLLPYSCAPVTQARHVFHGEIRQFSIAPSCSLDKLRWPRTITDTDSCLFMSVTQIKKKKRVEEAKAGTITASVICLIQAHSASRHFHCSSLLI